MNTREHILNVSFKLFLRKNFKEVTMKEIVEKTGLSKGAFYHYFESKEQLFLEVINHTLSSVSAVYSQLCKDSLHQFYQEYFQYYQKMSYKFLDEEEVSFDVNIFSLFIEGIKLFPHFQDKLHESLNIELNAWKEAIHNSRDLIKSTMSDEQIAKMFIYSSDGIGMHSIVRNGDSKEAMNKLIDLWDSFYRDLTR